MEEYVSTNSPSPDELRERALARIDAEAVNLDSELQKLLAMIKFAREALQKRMTSGLGYKQESVSKEDLQALKELATVFSVATDCQTRLDRTEEWRQKKMDKAAYLRLAKKLVMSLPSSERGHWITALAKEHRDNLVAVSGKSTGAYKVDELIASLAPAPGEPSPASEQGAEGKGHAE